MTQQGIELTVQSEGTHSPPMVDWGRPVSVIRRRFEEIARAEFRKQRKRLGVLSTEQEAAIEALLISTVNKLSHRAAAQMNHLLEIKAMSDKLQFVAHPTS